MTLKQNDASGGTSGLAVTTANSGGASGDALTVVKDAGTTVQYDSGVTWVGPMSIRVTGASGATARCAWLGWNATSMVARCGFYFDALPSVAAFRLIDIRTVSGVGIGRVSLNANNQPVFATGGGNLKTFTTVLSAGTWYRFEIAAVTGASGVLKCDLYAGTSSTPLETGYATTTGNSGATDNISEVRFGPSAATAWAGTLHLARPAAQDGTTTYLGVPGTTTANVPPAASAGADQTTEPWTSVTLTGTASDSDGTIASTSWAQAAGTAVTLSVTGSAATFTAPATVTGDTLTFAFTVVDDAGGKTVDTVDVVVPPVAERAVFGGVEVPIRITEVAS